MKWCIAHPQQKPFEVILDPELTLGLPKNLTAWTGRRTSPCNRSLCNK